LFVALLIEKTEEIVFVVAVRLGRSKKRILLSIQLLMSGLPWGSLEVLVEVVLVTVLVVVRAKVCLFLWFGLPLSQG
jgi:hypothetical protein